jgi:hypothetical protein
MISECPSRNQSCFFRPRQELANNPLRFWLVRLPFYGHFKRSVSPGQGLSFWPGRFIIIYLGYVLAQDRPSVAWRAVPQI